MNVSKGILFVVVPERRRMLVESWVRETIIPSARQGVRVLSDAIANTYGADVRDRVAERLTESFAAHLPSIDHKLMIDRDTVASISYLREWWSAHEFGRPEVQKLTPQALTREIKKHLQASRLDWRTHAETEVDKFEGPRPNLDAWLQQFSMLGSPSIGRKLSAQLRVVRTSDLPHHAFAIRPADTFGIARANCYVEDDDLGGSWSEIKSLLVHGVERSTVMAIKWDKASGTMVFPDVEVDEFVIYEDGLWSGQEAVRRLKAIALNPPAASIVFRFGIVTDFGLRVVRQAIRSLNLGSRVRIDASSSETILFLKKDLALPLQLGSTVAPEQYFRDLHDHVSPLAFGIEEDWTDREKAFCQTIGEQLAKHWLKGKTTPEALADKAALFSLGAGRFASTVLFSRSVPKVCLPLMWLDGLVDHEGRSIAWRPLFVDARRISDASLLYSP